MPKVVGRIEPLPIGGEKTYEFANEAVGGRIPREFIPAVDSFQEQMAKGTLIGFPIVGVRCVLSDGAYHDVDSSEWPSEFVPWQLCRQAYERAQPTALEPIMKLDTTAPEEFQGSVYGSDQSAPWNDLGHSEPLRAPC